MARVFTAKAAKDYPSEGIKKGESYYYYSPGFRGRKIRSKVRPRPSQLTTSKMSGALAAGEDLEDTIGACAEPSDLVDALRQCAETVREVAQEYRDAAESINSTAEGSPIAEDCETKADELESWADDLESDADEIESMDATDFVADDIAVEDLPEELRETKYEDCATCGGTKLVDGQPCDACMENGTPTGKQSFEERRDVTSFDDLTQDEQQEMLDAAINIAQQNSSCPCG